MTSARGVREVIITGADGFIGRAVLVEARRQGWRAHAVIEPSHALAGVDPDVVVHRADLTQPGTIDQLAAIRADAVIHLAAINPPASEHPDAFRHNVEMAQAAAAIARRQGSRLVAAGSSAEYGHTGVAVEETSPLRPFTAYGYAKAAISVWLLAESRSGQLDAVVLRPFIVYGPGQQGEMFIPSLVRALRQRTPFEMTQGQQRRDFVFVHDVASAFIAASVRHVGDDRVMNVSSGQGMRLLEVARIVADAFGCPELLRVGARPYRDGEAMEFFGSSSRAEAVLDWRARTTIADGLAQTVAHGR